ncbi:NAD(P)/FAD-dependent oxidoreductase [Novosphingobium sp.]|uniref:NAD(P)/FAD-dependent oxidoreductase n=1 Tax=Novosphingobium sp. TaxID=1874826 RepID=UPI0025CC8CC0|nr:FAD-dependent oxidoreductase [Novosphingobium sp.]
MQVAIVGAGIAGLSCASRLADRGLKTALFDKGNRPGGRLSTLVIDDMEWDFGAQFIENPQEPFSAALNDWIGAGLVAPWHGGPEHSFVPVPHMQSLVAALCNGHDVTFGAAVQQIERRPGGWFVRGADFASGPYDAVVIATPAEQAAPLLSLHDLVLAREAAAVRSAPCWTAMVGFGEPLPNVPVTIGDRDGVIWAARNTSKPRRGSAECWVLEAGPEWSRQNLEEAREDVATQLLALFAAEAGISLPEPTFLKAHRWRFARPHGTAGRTLWNERLHLGACGDWCIDATIAGAWQSGTALGERIAAELAPKQAAKDVA